MSPAGMPRVATAVAGAIEEVFATVALVREAALAALEPPAVAPARALDEPVRALLRRPDALATGLGVIVAPLPGAAGSARLHWWQADPDGGRVLALEPDLRPESVGFYDYATAPWFEGPRGSGRRHVTGPYVDVHGTGQYLLTLTEPLLAAGRFLGVAGADVPVSRFERRLLDRLDPAERSFLLIDEEDRVVLSGTSRWLVGDLLGDRDVGAPDALALPGLPWRLRVPAG